jgi:acetate kinase
LAVEVYVHQVRHWIGAFLFQLNGADALVFTAGIGENDTVVRRLVCASVDQLGIELDSEKNAGTKATESVISSPGSKVKIFVIPTNEELVVAREVKRFLEKNQAVEASGRDHPKQGTHTPDSQRSTPVHS